MPQLGLGLGLHKSSLLGSAYRDLIKASTWFIDPARPDGVLFPKLAPRTLPNGVSNGDYQQNISGDVVLQSSNITTVQDLTNITRAFIQLTTLTGILNYGVGDTVATKLNSSYSTPLNGAEFDNVNSIGKHYIRTTDWIVIFPIGTTLAQAQAILAGTVIRYQLATPIDTLNSPVRNPIQDQVGTADVTMTNVAWTSADGYRVETAPNGKQVVGFKCDGSDTYGVVASNGPNPVGTQDFAFGFVFKTGATQKFQYLYSIHNSASPGSPIIGIQISNAGVLTVYCVSGYSTGLTVSVNSWYKLVLKRVGGVLTAKLNEITPYTVSNSLSVATSSIKNLFARTSNVDGTAFTDYFNSILFHSSYNNGTDIAKWETTFNKFCAKEYGL